MQRTMARARTSWSLTSLLGLGFGAGLFVLGMCLIASGLSRPPSAGRIERGAQAKAAASARPTRAIQDVRVGDRVLAGNPEGAADEAEVDPPTWRKITLVMRTEGIDVDITLLRPLAWIETKGATAGGTVELDLRELDVVGPARVLAVDSCPPLKPGNGRVVTGTFAHDSEAVLDLRLEGLAEPIGVTPNHPFYSEDRRAFVRVRDLRAGERLRPLKGGTWVVSIASRPGRHRVYNLEVHGEHAFRVTNLGVLVHNDCAQRAVAAAQRNGGVLVRPGHYRFPNRQAARQAASEIAGNLGPGAQAIRLKDYRGAPPFMSNSNRVIGRRSADRLAGWRDDFLGHQRLGAGPHVNAWAEGLDFHLWY